jgi:hypothetical protein
MHHTNKTTNLTED